MKKTFYAKNKQISYIRGFSPISFIVFVMVSIPVIMGIVYIIINPKLRDIRYFTGLLVWIFVAYLVGSTCLVKISFLEGGIMIKDGFLWNTRRFFIPYEEIKYIEAKSNKLSIKTGIFSAYKYLIKKEDLNLFQKGMEVYRKWRAENE